MTLLYDLMLFGHITSVILWFSSIPIYMVMERILQGSENKGIVSLLTPVGIMVMISQVLVLITGGGMAGANWFKFTPKAWLAVKQVLFFGILGFSHTVILKNNREIKEMAEENPRNEAILDKFSKNVRYSYLSGILILINVFLATTKII